MMNNQLELAIPGTPRERALVAVSRGGFVDDFSEWLSENWYIWLAFESEANKAWDRGRKHYSARTIGEYLRHNTLVREASGEFKVNDHRWPDLARLYLAIYPTRHGFFELRGRE